MGPITGQWISGRQKHEILDVVESARVQRVSVRRSCTILAINRRRVVRWQSKTRNSFSLEDSKPGPREASHRLLPMERQQVLKLAKKEKYADLSHRILTVTAWDQNLFFMSFTTVYRILCSEGLMSQRGCCRPHNGRSVPPVRKELTGPNQRWCWDISYLPTYEKGLFLYLYLLLDEYSRKAISWLVSWQQNAQASKQLLDAGLVAENILDLPEDERPEIINDRGRQMKAKSVRRLLEDHTMPQLFARPRTPNDNPFIESAFSTIKRIHEYPGHFRDQEQAVKYFTRYFQWYNTEHYHSGIDYVTPQQAHEGLRERITAQRLHKLKQQRQRRREVNQHRTYLTKQLNRGTKTNNQSALCSVIE